MNVIAADRTSKMSRFDYGLRIFVIASFFAGSLALLYFQPSELYLTKCAFKEMTGYSCPTCGLTRSIHSLLNLHFVDSFLYHPMGIILFSGMFLLVVKFGYELLSGEIIRIKKHTSLMKHILFSIFFLWLVFWIFRFLIEL